MPSSDDRSRTPFRVEDAGAQFRRKRESADHNEDDPAEHGERLQKVLAAAGIGSRRDCETLILEGRVTVDGRVADQLGTRVDPVNQEIRVDGEALPRTKLVYYMVHKPQGVVSTSRDPSGRPRVIDLLPPTAGRLFAVGRLDMESEGLILLTNDGELANRLTHPRYGIEKTYHVQVAGKLEPEVLAQLKRGVHLAEGVARVVGAKIKGHHKKSTIIEMVLNEGRNREIRRLLARVGHKVQRLVRVAVGPVRLGDMPSGAYRALDREEVQELRKLARGIPLDQRKKREPRDRMKSARRPGGGPQAKSKRPGKRGARRPGGIKSEFAGEELPTINLGGRGGRTVIGGEASELPSKPRPAGGRPIGAKPAGGSGRPTKGKRPQRPGGYAGAKGKHSSKGARPTGSGERGISGGKGLKGGMKGAKGVRRAGDQRKGRRP
jgi:23S rRNA pseudouridine2605 synthase